MAAERSGPEPVGGMESEDRWSKTARTWIPELGDERRIRVARLRKELSLEERAAADGRQNQPAKSDGTLNEPQLDICNRVFSGILLLNQFLDEQLGLAVERARVAAPEAIDSTNLISKITSEINRVFAQRRPELAQLRIKDLESQRELRYFRNQNGLNRQARYKESWIYLVGVLMGVFVVESVLNGALLSQVMAGGLAGGALLAGAISILNIGLGLSAGLYGWRNLGHRNTGRRILGGVVTVAFHGVALFWNILVAHFREVAEAASANANYNFELGGLAAATLPHLATHGLLGLSSIFSWALFVLGLVIHLLAAKEGWDDVADRYPDYKPVDLNAKLAHADFENAFLDLHDEASAAAEGIVRGAEETYEAGRRQLTQISSMIDIVEQREKEVRDSEDEWVVGGNQLLKVYRDLNNEVRDPGSAPAYFERFPSAKDYRQRTFGAGIDGAQEINIREKGVERKKEDLRAIKAAAAKTVEGNAQALEILRASCHATLEKLEARLEEVRAAATILAEEEVRRAFDTDRAGPGAPEAERASP